MIEGLYYPQSPYMFNIIEPNLLGKIYEIFLTEQLTLSPNGRIELSRKKDCVNRSAVTTPLEVVRYIVEKTLSKDKLLDIEKVEDAINYARTNIQGKKVILLENDLSDNY